MGKPKTPEEEKIYQELMKGHPIEIMAAKSLYKDETTKETWAELKKELEILKKEF